MIKPLALPSSELASPRNEERLFLLDMSVLRQLSISSFALKSAGSLCDGSCWACTAEGRH